MRNLLEKLRNDKKLIIVILIGCLGALMLLFAGSGNDTSASDMQTEMQTTSMATSYGEIEQILEKKIEDIVSQVTGAGNVSAVVSVASTGEYIYASNKKNKSGIDSSSEDSEIVIYESENGGDTGLIISIKSPEIIGVAIVCEGGESSVVKAEVTHLVTSLFGIGSDRVYVGSKAKIN